MPLYHLSIHLIFGPVFVYQHYNIDTANFLSKMKIPEKTKRERNLKRAERAEKLSLVFMYNSSHILTPILPQAGLHLGRDVGTNKLFQKEKINSNSTEFGSSG